MVEKKNRLRTACAILAALLIAMIALNAASSEALSDANLRIRAVYQRAFYETCELSRGISVNYRKLLVSADGAQMLDILGEISRRCQGASANLSLLPLERQTIGATLKFVNQAEDFARTLSEKISSGDGVSQADRDAMQALADAAAQLADGMNLLLERYESGEMDLAIEDFASADAESIRPLAAEEADYPSLLYDGAFSDGITAGNYEMLIGQEEITAGQAEGELRAFMPVDELRFLGESTPEIGVYEFSFRSGKHNLTAAVAKKGGFILYILPEQAVFEEKLPADRLSSTAEDFLRSRGYGDVEMRYYSALDGVLTVNFAAVQDGVILYPDLVKVQLSMEDGAIIGLDAKSYLKNHRVRHIDYPRISESEAMAAVGDNLDPSSARLCIIPRNREEFLCYEVAASHDGEQFLAYIDAQTGVERDLKQLLNQENGTLVM